LEAFGSFADLKFHGLAFVQAAIAFRLNRGVMHENILTALALNEAEAFAGVEPLHCSLFFHLFPLLDFELFGGSFCLQP
jgi:hypothetical protein